MRALVLLRLSSLVDRDYCFYPLKVARLIKEQYKIPFDVMALVKNVEDYKCAYAYGADTVFVLNDIRFAGSETYKTASLLGAAIKKTKCFYDLILCGQVSGFGETGHVPPAVSVQIGYPFLPGINRILKLDHSGMTCSYIGFEEKGTININLPVVISVHYSFDLSLVTEPTLFDYVTAEQKEIVRWGYENLIFDDLHIKYPVMNIESSGKSISTYRESIIIDSNEIEQVRLFESLIGQGSRDESRKI